jgi:hypothetical protein
MQLMHDSRTKQKSLSYQYYINMVQVTRRSAYKPLILWCGTRPSFMIRFHTLHFRSHRYTGFVFVTANGAGLIRLSAQEYMISFSSVTHYPFTQGMIIFALWLIYSKVDIVNMLFACWTIYRYQSDQIRSFDINWLSEE